MYPQDCSACMECRDAYAGAADGGAKAGEQRSRRSRRRYLHAEHGLHRRAQQPQPSAPEVFDARHVVLNVARTRVDHGPEPLEVGADFAVLADAYCPAPPPRIASAVSAR